MERGNCSHGGFAPLAGAVQDAAFGGAAEDLRLQFVRVKTELRAGELDRIGDEAGFWGLGLLSRWVFVVPGAPHDWKIADENRLSAGWKSYLIENKGRKKVEIRRVWNYLNLIASFVLGKGSGPAYADCRRGSRLSSKEGAGNQPQRRALVAAALLALIGAGRLFNPRYRVLS
jgi:hypothetical protein